MSQTPANQRVMATEAAIGGGGLELVSQGENLCFQVGSGSDAANRAEETNQDRPHTCTRVSADQQTQPRSNASQAYGTSDMDTGPRRPWPSYFRPMSRP
jgi:hypothetical protein